MSDAAPREFDADTRAAIVAAYVSGTETITEIAARFGCSKPWPGRLARQAGFPPRGLPRRRRKRREKART